MRWLPSKKPKALAWAPFLLLSASLYTNIHQFDQLSQKELDLAYANFKFDYLAALFVQRLEFCPPDTCMKTITLSLAILLLAGCAAVERVAESGTALRVGTSEYIEGDKDRAARVLEWAESAIDTLEGSEEVTLSRLQAEAEQRIPWDEMTPAQRILAQELLFIIEQRIGDQIQAGLLSRDAVEHIRTVLEVIHAQAQRERNRVM